MANGAPHARARTWTREEMLEEAEDIRVKALEHKRTYMNRDGDVHESHMPEFRAALAAVELKCKLLGILGDGKNMTLEQLKAELDRAGYELRPKKLKAVK